MGWQVVTYKMIDMLSLSLTSKSPNARNISNRVFFTIAGIKYDYAMKQQSTTIII